MIATEGKARAGEYLTFPPSNHGQAERSLTMEGLSVLGDDSVDAVLRTAQ
jgi:hypothetical protein